MQTLPLRRSRYCPPLANKAAFILELCRQGLIQGFVTPEILSEYQRVLSDTPTLLAEIQEHFAICYPLFTAIAIRHEPDNRFLECALACQADYLITVNTARGHFDRKSFGGTLVLTPEAFLNHAPVRSLLLNLP